MKRKGFILKRLILALLFLFIIIAFSMTVRKEDKKERVNKESTIEVDSESELESDIESVSSAPKVISTLGTGMTIIGSLIIFTFVFGLLGCSIIEHYKKKI